MKMKPSRILLVICGAGILVAASLGLPGIILQSHALKEAGAIIFFVTAFFSCLPLVFALCYVGWQKLQSRLKPKVKQD
jgi:hypothetical protein